MEIIEKIVNKLEYFTYVIKLKNLIYCDKIMKNSEIIEKIVN